MANFSLDDLFDGAGSVYMHFVSSCLYTIKLYIHIYVRI